MQSKNKSQWDDIFCDDVFVQCYKPEKVAVINDVTTQLIESFEKVNSFIDKYGSEPKKTSKMGLEHTYYLILHGLRANAENAKKVAEYDRHNLLMKHQATPSSISDIMNDEIFSMIDPDVQKIFDVVNVTSQAEIRERAKADEIAQKTKCEDFNEFEHLFKNCQKEINDKQRKIIKFKENTIVEGSFFMLNGVLVYLASIGKTHKGKDYKTDGRTRCIFDNGTESNLLLRSLIKRLYESGYSITEPETKTIDDFNRKMSGITSNDKSSGYMYILKSLSSDIRLSEIGDLYKIGFSTTTVEDRIKNAENEPTYLMASVEIIASCECYNMNPQKFELIIHKLFGNSCLNVDVYDYDRNRHTPREWFIVPLRVVMQAFELIVSENIIGCSYDTENKEIVFSEVF